MLHLELVWMTPVAVRMKDESPQVFASVNDALDFLEGDWAIYRGRITIGRFKRAAVL